MRFCGNGAEAHRPGTEPPDDGTDRFDLLQGDGLVLVLELEQATQGTEPLALVVDQIREAFVLVAIP